MLSTAPACLLPYADLPAWVGWMLIKVKGELRKVPQRVDGSGNASVADPSGWGTLAAARRLAEVRCLSGVGIVSAAVSDLVFLDLDDCLDPATGEPVNDDALRLLEMCQGTYAERTPSGAGARIIGIAPQLMAPISCQGVTAGGLRMEIYSKAARYLTVTGRRYEPHPDRLADIGDTVLDLLPLLGASSESEAGTEARGDAELVRCIVTGNGLHAELCALAARYIGRRMSAVATGETLRGLMLSHPEQARDARWQDRYDSISDLVKSAARKFIETTEHRSALASLAGRLWYDGRPSAEVLARVRAEANARGIPAEQADAIARFVAERELARRGASNG